MSDDAKEKKLHDAYVDLPEAEADAVIKAIKDQRRQAEAAARKRDQQRIFMMGLVLALFMALTYWISITNF